MQFLPSKFWAKISSKRLEAAACNNGSTVYKTCKLCIVFDCGSWPLIGLDKPRLGHFSTLTSGGKSLFAL